MTKSALPGPLIIYGDRPPPGTGPTGSNNPDKAPSPIWGGTSVFDFRAGYNNTIAGAIGFYTDNGSIILDAAPSTIADNNIVAIYTPGAGARTLTLVSASGAGVTVLATATQYQPSGTTIPINTLILDSAPALVGFGRASLSNSGHTVVSVYDPTTMLSRNVRITSGGNDTGITFTVSGWDVYGYPMTETITGVSGSVASGKKAFKFIASIVASGNVATTVKVGTGDVYGFPLRVDDFFYTTLSWNGSGISANTGFVAAVTTTATATTGDVRGTYAVQTASDGTKKLQAYISLSVANVSNTNPTTGLFGVTQA